VSACHRDLTLFVHQEEVSVTHAVIEAIAAALEPLLDALELQAVLEALGVRRETGSTDLARIVLEGLEIPVGVRNQALPGYPLCGGHDLVQDGIVAVLVNVPDRRRRSRQIAPRRQDVLDLRDLAVFDLQ